MGWSYPKKQSCANRKTMEASSMLDALCHSKIPAKDVLLGTGDNLDGGNV